MKKSLEEELQAAFTAAAEQVLSPRPSFEKVAAEKEFATKAAAVNPRRRWIMPAVAAAAAVLVMVPAALWAVNVAATSNAAQVKVSGAISSVGGISFPVPDGWKVETVASDSESVTVCVATDPALDCSGATITVVIPDPITGSFDPLPDPAISGCRWIQLAGEQVLAHRPAQVSTIGCTPTGPKSLAWYLTDGSLSITAPPEAATQATLIAKGLDLTEWANHGGEVIVETTSAG